MIEVVNFKKQYGDQTILSVPNLLIPAGISWFQGVNGSGKSTFLKGISGIIPFEGDVILNKKISFQQEPLAFRKRVNYCFAEPVYPDFLSGKDILDYHQKVYKTDFDELAGLMNELKIHEFIDKPIRNYSSGMLKKVGLIAALIGKPEILILDEPLTTIDLDLQVYLLDFVAKLPCSVLLASHHEISSTHFKVQHIFKVENQSIARV